MFFDSTAESAPDAVFGKLKDFQADGRGEKISLMVGIYKDEELRSQMLPSVIAAKERAAKVDQIADYLPFDGPSDYVDLLGSVALGKDRWVKERARIYGTLTVGGTSALSLGADLIGQEVGKRIAIPSPTWANHRAVFERSGLAVQEIPYYSVQMHGFDRGRYLNALRQLDRGTAVLLHGACHNPTGCDPTMEDWNEIASIMKERMLLPLFDFAYQGFGEGWEQDAAPIGHFVDSGVEVLIAYSCSKNFSLYCHRVGALFAICSNEKNKVCVGSQIRRIIRSTYSNPPIHGAKIVTELLRDSSLSAQWKGEVEAMRQRLVRARNMFLEKLISQVKAIDFSFARRHKGMFSYLDLSDPQVKQLIERHGIYMLGSGRLNIAGLTSKNVDQVVEAIAEVCRQ